MINVVILGDVHGNAGALRAALAQARSGPMDRLIFVGDLLTYGHDVEQVIELVDEAQRRDRAVLVIGNHDQMYFDLEDGPCAYVERLPRWIRDSVELTRERLRGTSLRNSLAWSDEHFADDVLVAHANPFGPGDYRYLVEQADAEAAGAALLARGAAVGVFGHTHRARWRGCGREAEPALDTPLTSTLEAPVIANAGAVGQPRDDRACSVILRLAIQRDRATAIFETVTYDVDAHLASLRETKLPAETVNKLCSFFMPGRPHALETR